MAKLLEQDMSDHKIPDPNKRFKGQPFLFGYINGKDWYTPHNYAYRTKADEVSTIRKGFQFDFASIPRVLYSVYPPAGNGRERYGIAAAWHDHLYVGRTIQGRTITRKEADLLFLEIMRYIGVSLFTARAMYRAVRLFGWIPWKMRQPDDTIE